MPPVSTGKSTAKPSTSVKPLVKLVLKKQSDILYPEVTVKICRGDEAITVAQAKELLGWEEETQTVKFGEDYLFTDENKRKIRCWNNTKNRPFNDDWSRTISQDILNKKWRFNCETIIIGKSGQIISGQHRLIGLVLASQLWDKAEPNHQWKRLWEGNVPVIESLVAFGAEESDEFTQTQDNVRSRTLADTLYTSQLFKTWKPRDKKNVVKVADYAVRLLWTRTGMSNSKYASKITNTEAYEFLNRHLKLLDAVKHIFTEDIKGSIRNGITLGYAAGLLYLQAASNDDRETYDATTPPEESTLSLERWPMALKFWIGFSVSKRFDVVKKLLMAVDEDEVRIPLAERIGIIVKAWEAYLADEVMDKDRVGLTYFEDASGKQVPGEFPTFGGIDTGTLVVADPNDPPF